MNVTSPDPKVPPSELGNLLRYWRDVRGVSQLDLSLEASVSQRQISFIESGRSVPGRHTILSLAQTLDVPLRERNALLLAAGYAPVYSEAPWNAQEMHSVIRALERVVRQHEPYPAIVMVLAVKASLIQVYPFAKDHPGCARRLHPASAWPRRFRWSRLPPSVMIG